ncbi:hypothetical protein AXF42_Ash005163 [Apostasia shenzhenica]|uniref:Uncharacterized protein n=1 Tax=Apostasia shenzhenica TaxID=1088818 RepID=A0A2I0B8N5_9ASPA|nr:hypothetical protein AXF42_Ash005163 [Apostasia shenzhenica]
MLSIVLTLEQVCFALVHLDGRQPLIRSNPVEDTKLYQCAVNADEGIPHYQRPFMKG